MKKADILFITAQYFPSNVFDVHLVHNSLLGNFRRLIYPSWHVPAPIVELSLSSIFITNNGVIHEVPHS